MVITNGLKISQLDTATEFETTDFFAVARGSKTYKLQGTDVINKVTGTQRYVADVPTNKTANIVHNLKDLDVHVTVKDKNTGEVVYPSIIVLDLNTIQLKFNTKPTTNQYRVLVTK
jgi:hypothetical protein